jgi:uncharacterized glyoxalase superfamily protein PhnB
MKSTPAGWPRISSCVFYDDAPAAIDWLCRAFGFEVRLKVEGDDGSIVHSELTFGEGLVGVNTAGEKAHGGEYQRRFTSPRSVDGRNTQTLCVFVDDVDAHCERARKAGAQVFREPATNDYGDDYWSDRSYGALDPEGHTWWFIQRIRDPRPRG